MAFAYGDDSEVLTENRVAATQTLSGTGGLRVMGELLAKFGHKHIYVPNRKKRIYQAMFVCGKPTLLFSLDNSLTPPVFSLMNIDYMMRDYFPVCFYL